MPCAIYPRNTTGSASVWSSWYQTVGRVWLRTKSAIRVVLPHPASAATIVMGEPRLACSFVVSRGRRSNSLTARGGSNFVRRKKFLSCIASTRPVEKAVLCHVARMQIEERGYSRGLDGLLELMNGKSFETRPNVSA